MSRPILLCALLLASAACGSSPLAPELTFRLIAQGGFSTMPAGMRVFTDASTWNTFASEADLRPVSSNPNDPIPAVDFRAETAVVLMLGQRPTSGYAVEVRRIVDTGSTVLIEANEIKPCVGATVLTYPLLVIAVPGKRSGVRVDWTVVPRCG